MTPPGMAVPGDVEASEEYLIVAISLRKNKCVHGMKPVECPECLRLWAEYMEDQREVEEHAHAARLAAEALPATDREWNEHLATSGYDESEWTLCTEVG